MKPNEYQQLAMRTECDQRASADRQHESALVATRLLHGIMGVTKEGGELLSLYEKWIYYGQTLDSAKIADELGDVLWYAALVADALGYHLEEIMQANVEKLRRRYPVKFGATEAMPENRDREAEMRAVRESLQSAIMKNEKKL